MSHSPKIHWRERPFHALTLQELYDSLQLRQQVFVVEQNCPYLDSDGQDAKALHISGYVEDRCVAYARILPPEVSRPASIGRIVVDAAYRGTGTGHELMERSLRILTDQWGPISVRLAAQVYLESFYERFGFSRMGDVYPWDGIPHIDMEKP